MAPIGKRVRGWVWAHPGRARMAVAGVVLAAVAGGAFIGLRPDHDSAAGRLRHRQYARSIGADGGEGPDPAQAPTGSTAEGAGAAVGRAPGGTGTAGTGAPTTAGGTAAGTSDGTSDPTIVGGSSNSATGAGASGSDDAGAPTGPVPGTGTTGGRGTGTGRGGPAAAAGSPGWALLPKAPIGARTSHTAIWTGREMVIWGGYGDFDSDPSTDGAAYDPATRAWRKLPAAPLAPRYDARAFWTGQEMLLYGGTVDGDIQADGAAWNPATNTWRSIPVSPLGPRDGAVVAWAGDRLVIWSGNTALPSAASADMEPEVKGDGAAYVPATNSWVPINPAPIPARSGAQSAWTGSRLIISGGLGDDNDRTDGAALDPASGAWSPIATRLQPGSCGGASDCAGVWTGTAVLFPASALAYDPGADRWSDLAPPPGADAPAPGEPAAWAGRRLLTWGLPGGDDDGSEADTTEAADGPTPPVAAMYDPVANQWQPFAAGPLRARTSHSAVWTGDALLVWGGSDAGEDDAALADGAAYRPE